MTRPSAVTVTVNGSSSSSAGSAFAAVLGSSTGTPTVSKGAATMKMISRTSITSTKGVTLISLMGCAGPTVCDAVQRRRRRIS